MRWQYRETVLAVCTLALFVTVYGRLALSPVVPDIASEFAVSNGLIGAALSGMWLTYALTQFPSGILAERYGERLVILASIAGTVLTTLVIVASPGFVGFSIGVLLLGALAGLHYSVATTLLARVYDDIGTVIGIHNAGAPLAGLVAPVVVAWVAVRYGWRPAVFLTVAVGLPILVLAGWRIRPTEPRHPTKRLSELFDRDLLGGMLTRPSVLFTGVIAIIVEFSWQAVASFLPAFFAQYHGYSTEVAGVLFGVYFLTQGVLQVGVGVIADRFGRDLAIGICMATGIGGIVLLVTGDEFVVISSGTLLLGIGMGWGAAVFPRFMDHLSADEKSVGFGLFRTVYMTVAASGSVVVGLLADFFGWAVSFWFLAALLALVCVLLAVNSTLNVGY